ncbi:DHS-like NAD/FAD-binding domain-containing protein [Glonium stellatum]|uniref:DHS-like NAD/FAD-binding domain-containing protein n=1 Tax=Glonium stellatum TaxID=574774 RepID=A0A8E2EXI3_9PEZI|nr:DHS-like NAD/FAD-binding domain-containing protein [Glonium stellatum]
MIHHSIGQTPDHQVYNMSSRLLRAAAAELWDVKTAPYEIDRVIRECFIQSCPVYIFMPLYLAMEEVPAGLLDTRIDISLPVDPGAQDAAVGAIKQAVSNAQNPSVLIDALVHRHNAVQETLKLIDKLQIPFYVANCGKSIIDETHPLYVGVYNGKFSSLGVADACESSDTVLVLGYLPSDTNSGGFSRKLPLENCVTINPHNVIVKGQNYPNIFIKPLLSRLSSILADTPIHEFNIPRLLPPLQPKDFSATHITQSWIWHRLAKFFQPGDIVIGETGTACFGLLLNCWVQ